MALSAPVSQPSLKRGLAAVALCFAGTLALALSGATVTPENALRNVGFALGERPASGQLHLVEMDAASLKKIDRWPWPRGHYARVIDRLRRAGVRSITFDVDFASVSNPVQDARMAAALERTRGIVALPTFSQRASHDSERSLDALPIESFRPHVSLVSVSVAPDADGLVRNLPMGTMTKGLPRPSLAAHIAGRSGRAEENFPIDFAIDPQTIPRHSFVAIETGQFDPSLLRGKDILIGATAIELDDRHVVPRHGVLPGVVVQALGAETLYRGVPIVAGWFFPLLLAAASAIWILGARSRNSVLLRGFATAGGILGLSWIAMTGASIYLEIVPALCMVALAGSGRALSIIRRETLHKRLHDPESGLPNRKAMECASTASDGFTVATKIDGFDGLKTVLGDAVIGQLIARLAERLAVGAGAETIYRIDDRVLAWTVVMEPHTLEETLVGLRAMMHSPLEVGGRRVDLTLGYGIAEACAPDEAVHAAGLALREGRPWRYHQVAERAALAQQLSLMSELDTAIERNELIIFYQPKLELASDSVTSVEALVRWEHPVRGLIRPDNFIPLAEESDRIDGLTLYVLRRTIEDMRIWCAQGLVVKAAVNISARLIASPPFLAAAEALLSSLAVPRDRLIFEITESAAMADPDSAAEALRHFRDLGVDISMDDYGTGQSTLTYLKNLPLSELKIDKSFVQDAHRDANDGLLVRSTIDLAHELGLKVVAEGVEEEECLAFLREIGCDFAQGYLIGKPMDAAALAKLAARPIPRAA